jgi:hypothetical protein
VVAAERDADGRSGARCGERRRRHVVSRGHRCDRPDQVQHRVGLGGGDGVDGAVRAGRRGAVRTCALEAVHGEHGGQQQQDPAKSPAHAHLRFRPVLSG